MKKLELVLLLGLVGSLFFGNVARAEETVEQLESDVLRIHILANSDSEEDQALKCRVRDRLLAESESLFGNAPSLDAVTCAAESGLERIRSLAKEVICESGYDYDVEAALVNMPFDEREYGDITMPAGTYDAVRVTIGEAAGHNWWCVMYPPLCIPAASGVTGDPEAAEDYFSEEEYDVMTNPKRYEARFKCVELWDKLVEKLTPDEKPVEPDSGNMNKV